jgi:hypothetical protein
MAPAIDPVSSIGGFFVHAGRKDHGVEMRRAAFLQAEKKLLVDQGHLWSCCFVRNSVLVATLSSMHGSLPVARASQLCFDT